VRVARNAPDMAIGGRHESAFIAFPNGGSAMHTAHMCRNTRESDKTSSGSHAACAPR